MNREAACTKIKTKLGKLVDSDSTLKNAFLLIHSDRLNIHWNIAYGITGDMQANESQPYHTASIGKVFTAVIIAKLVEKGTIHYDDPIAKYLDRDVVKGLHVYKGKDYSKEIQVKHLVSNTSGLPDFYEDKPHQGKSFLNLMLDEPSQFWTPEETIQWTKESMHARFEPGKKCHYTNTAYNLLGLIIENVTAKSYHEVLHENIFQPLQMNHSYLGQYSEPAKKSEYPVATIQFRDKGINVEELRSSSSIYAGGQTVSTSEDLLLFMKALVKGEVISGESLEVMKDWKKLWPGVDYGYGLMRVRMFPSKYNVWGPLGSTGSFMLYNQKLDVYVIGTLNRSGYTNKSMRLVYNVLRTVSKMKEEQYA